MNFMQAIANEKNIATVDDYEMRNAAKQGDLYSPGTGKNFMFLIPIIDPATGKFEVVFDWAVHRLKNGPTVVCMRETFNLPCPVCDARYGIAKETYLHTPEQWRHPHLKKSGLYTDDRRTSVIRLMQDSGEKGTDKYPRPVYKPGALYRMEYKQDPYNSLLRMLQDRDLNSRGMFFLPDRARMLNYEILGASESGTNRRKHSLTIRQVDPMPIYRASRDSHDPDVDAINGAIKYAMGLYVWAQKYNIDQETAAQWTQETIAVMDRRDAGERATLPLRQPVPFDDSQTSAINEAIELIKADAYKETRKMHYVPKHLRNDTHRDYNDDPTINDGRGTRIGEHPDRSDNYGNTGTRIDTGERTAAQRNEPKGQTSAQYEQGDLPDPVIDDRNAYDAPPPADPGPVHSGENQTPPLPSVDDIPF